MGAVCCPHPLKRRYIRYKWYIPIIERDFVHRMYRMVKVIRYIENGIGKPMYRMYRLYRLIRGGVA